MKPKTTDEAQDDTASLVLRALAVRPGLVLSRIARLVARSRNAVDYCINKLVKDGTVVEDQVDGHSVYLLPKQTAGAAFTLTGPQLRFLDVVARCDGATGAEIADVCEMSRSDVSRIGSGLEDRGLIVAVRQGRNVVFLPRQAESHVAA